MNCSVARIGLALLLCSPAVLCEEPAAVSVCQLKSDPPANNHKLVKVTGLVSHGFEDFTLQDSACPAASEVWLEYGGRVSPGTIYCCPGSPERSRPKELVVDGIKIPLVKDQLFQKFDRL